MNNYLLKPSKLQFELSSMCNALCLGCVRTDPNTFNNKKFQIPDKQYITFDVFKKILLAPEFDSVDELEFCGTIDDPLMHPELLEFLEFASAIGKYNIMIHTNASLRNTEYWTKLAYTLKKHKRHTVKFSIDGLEDTNHLYRQNTTWSKIMENAEAFISAGGQAMWQYLIFPWNKDQISEAKELSVKMGFWQFVSRHDRSMVTSIGMEHIQERKKSHEVAVVPITSIDSINEKLKNIVINKISCNNQEKKMYFISFDGRLWPCCFMQNGLITNDQGRMHILKKRLYSIYGSENWNDINEYSIGEILSHEFYVNDLVTSWSSTQHGFGKQDRIHRCTEVCSVKNLEKLPIGNYKVL
jgi:MoaA/NifB/PqqE/SkfB family radical SAM enzyme